MTATAPPAAPAPPPPTPEPATDATPDAPRPLGRRFAALLTATGAANLGDGIVAVGVPLVALGLTRSPDKIALLSAATWLPWLVLGLTAGVLVDRGDRRRLQIAGLAARAALLAVGGWLAATDALTLPLLVGLVLAYGVTEVVVDLAAGAIVPDLVPRERLAAANGRVMAVQQVANAFLGAPVAGALLTLGTGWVLGVPAALAVAGALVLWRHVPGRYRRTAPATPAPTTPATTADGAASPDAAARRTSAWSDVREGLRFVTRHRVLRVVVLTGAVLNMCSAAYFAVFVLWVVGPGSAVGMTEQTYPLLTLGIAVGAVAGSVLGEPLVRRVGEVRLMVTCWALAFSLLAVPVLVPRVAPLAVVLVLLGLLSTVGNVISETVRQRLVPAHLLGRVAGAARTLGYGLMPAGALVAGVLATRHGLAPVLLGATALSVVAVAAAAAVLRQRDVDAHELPAPAPVEG
ncbi:MFS transporter [Cellulomonas iranensis]|uniref:MFS transporter n=1 Tax=Cellulomonas iranensis TaxID=76862 RepID=UPI003D7DA81A